MCVRVCVGGEGAFAVVLISRDFNGKKKVYPAFPSPVHQTKNHEYHTAKNRHRGVFFFVYFSLFSFFPSLPFVRFLLPPLPPSFSMRDSSGVGCWGGGGKEAGKLQ